MIPGMRAETLRKHCIAETAIPLEILAPELVKRKCTLYGFRNTLRIHKGGRLHMNRSCANGTLNS